MVLDRTEHAGMKTGETTCTNAASTTAAPVHVPPTGNCAARQLMCHKHHKCDMRMHNSALGDDTARRRTSSAPHSARNTPSAASPTDVWTRHPRTSRVPLLRAVVSCGAVTGHGRGWFLTSWTVTIERIMGLAGMPAARAHAVRARAVHPRAGRVVHLCSVRSDRATSARQRRRHRGVASARALCWRCACLRCRACVPHARVACTCCTCACCACLRYACLRFPCSRCVHLLCLPLLCVPALCAFCAVCGVLVQRSPTSCGAR